MDLSNLDPQALILLVIMMAVLPFVIMVGTSFVKISIIFSLLRNALGIQQIPPNMVLHGLALILTMYIMAPVGIDSYENISSQKVALDDLESLHAAFDRGMGPYREFLLKHSDERQREFFKDTARQLWADEHHQNITDENIIILLPAFMLGELVIAFEIGFLIYMPFVVIDLIISNILMAMGMMMMSPTTISLPFKLLLFVFLDGWVRLIQGLILSYQ